MLQKNRTLITFSPCFGIRSPSPFTLKVEALLTMAELPYTCRFGTPQAGPRGKLPVLIDGDVTIPDSRLIRRHLEAEYRIDFDEGLSAEDRARSVALHRVCEEHLYWAQVYFRWMDHRRAVRDAYFAGIPRPLRDVVSALVYRQAKRDLWGHGLGRMTRDEIVILAKEDLQAFAQQLADKPFMFGDRPTALDAAFYGLVANILVPELDGPLYDAALPLFESYAQRFSNRVFGTARACPAIDPVPALAAG